MRTLSGGPAAGRSGRRRGTLFCRIKKRNDNYFLLLLTGM
ncbi:hypothetical protein HMPREF0889_1687 [Megasphaera lornae]|uniref:Uncharacterized protein n=1 Tax=Megasphaera lornae TaxID=1000568 RepID=D3LUY8_9FIRM|nr:hypothetical protein HMPREF0889_1687 [Megasphaera genomosp. type_1 str. 28L]